MSGSINDSEVPSCCDSLCDSCTRLACYTFTDMHTHTDTYMHTQTRTCTHMAKGTWPATLRQVPDGGLSYPELPAPPNPLTGTHLLLHWPVFIVHPLGAWPSHGQTLVGNPQVPAPPGGVAGPRVGYKHEGEGRAAGRLERPCVRQPAGGW